MGEKLIETLRNIESDLAGRVAEKRAELGPLESELAGVRRAIAALDPTSKFIATNPARGATIAELAMRVIEAFPEGASTNMIRGEIENNYGRSIPRESLAPQLSRLSRAGKLTRNYRLWRASPPRQQKT